MAEYSLGTAIDVRLFALQLSDSFAPKHHLLFTTVRVSVVLCNNCCRGECYLFVSQPIYCHRRPLSDPQQPSLLCLVSHLEGVFSFDISSVFSQMSEPECVRVVAAPDERAPAGDCYDMLAFSENNPSLKFKDRTTDSGDLKVIVLVFITVMISKSIWKRDAYPFWMKKRYWEFLNAHIHTFCTEWSSWDVAQKTRDSFAISLSYFIILYFCLVTKIICHCALHWQLHIARSACCP